MLLSVRRCAEHMTQLPRLKVTDQGHVVYPSIRVPSISHESFERFSLNFTQTVCREHDQGGTFFFCGSFFFFFVFVFDILHCLCLYRFAENVQTHLKNHWTFIPHTICRYTEKSCGETALMHRPTHRNLRWSPIPHTVLLVVTCWERTGL